MDLTICAEDKWWPNYEDDPYKSCEHTEYWFFSEFFIQKNRCEEGSEDRVSIADDYGIWYVEKFQRLEH